MTLGSETLAPEVLTLLQEEERILAETLRSLREQQIRSAERLSVEENRARHFTAGIVNTRREEDKQMLASDEAVAHGLSRMKREELKDLEKLLEKPYFARVAVEEEKENGGTRMIEYKIGNRANTDCRIIDWKKAPISKLYYEYQEGESYFEEILGKDREGVIRLRNKIDIDGGVLKRVTCRYGTFVLNDGTWTQSSSRTRARKGKEYAALPDILSLISPEQFRAITQDAQSAVLIQGVAGSGKTSVAIHRLQWLLSEGNSEVRASKLLVLVRSPVLKQYIQHTLATVELPNIRVETYEHWMSVQASKIIAFLVQERDLQSIRIEEHASSQPGITRVKRSFAMLRSLEEYVDDQHQRLKGFLEQELPWSQWNEATALRIRKTIDASTGAPLALLDLVADALPEGGSSPAVRERLEHARRRLLLFTDDLLRIVRDPQLILKNDETLLLDRELVQQAADDFRIRLERGALSSEDASLLVQLFQLKAGPNPKKQIIETNYDHIMADEVQDFSALELATMIRSVSSVDRLTLVGDAAQAVSHESTFPGWDKLRKHYRFSSSLSQFVTLSVSFRSTTQIIRVAESLSGTPMGSGGKEGARPRWYKSLEENHAMSSAISWLETRLEEDPEQLIAVLCRTPEEAKHVVSLLEPTFRSLVRLGQEESFVFEEGIVVSAIKSVKGLEFPAVLLWDVSARNYPATETNKNLLYVGMTRAEEHLALVTWEKESPLLRSLPQRFLDIVEQEPPEDEEPEMDLFDQSENF